MPRSVLYFVRHGETDWNLERRLQGQHDIPLNPLGRMQAVRCGEILGDLLAASGHAIADYDYVSSPLGRARETMDHDEPARGRDVGEEGLHAPRGDALTQLVLCVELVAGHRHDVSE